MNQLSNQHNLCTFSSLKEDGVFKPLDSSLIASIESLGNDKEIDASNRRWYYTDNDDEFEMYGFDEQNELENNWQNFMNNKGERLQEATAGYFANCYDKHYIDFLNFNQYNVDTKESRGIIRAVSNNELNNKFIQINSPKNIADLHDEMQQEQELKIEQPAYCELQRNLLKEEHCGGDAVLIKIPSIINSIICDTLYVGMKEYDIPIGTAVINKDNELSENEYYKKIDNLLDCFIKYQYLYSNNGVTMDIIKLYHQSHLKVNSSMISHLISEEKINFILYDTDFQLLAVGKFNGEYIHQYNNNDINPYQYESFINFHILLSSFYELSLMNNNCLKIDSLISCFNKNVRSCLVYNNYTLWTPAINDRQIFKQIIQRNICIVAEINKINKINKINYANSVKSDNDNDIDIDIDTDIIDEYQSECSSSPEPNIDECYYSDSDESINSDSIKSIESIHDIFNNIECSICYHDVINPSYCHNHKDVCYSCSIQWKQNGHDSCPKCGVQHIQ